MTERFERLTDLVTFLLETNDGATLHDIAEEVPGYPPGDVARRQAFERDKAILREENIPLREEKGRYRIPPEEYYLPDLELSEEEQAALRIALTAVRVGGDAGGSALHKLTLAVSGGTDGGASLVATLDEHPALPTIHSALRRRAPVTFTYNGAERTVEPQLVWFREGNWYLAGYDRLRDADRTYRIDRIDGDVTVGEAGTAERRTVPGSTPMARQPWLLPVDEPIVAVVRVDPVLAGKAVAEAGADAHVDHGDDGSVTITMPVTHRGAFRSWLLGFLDRAELVSPPELRGELVAWLEALAAGGAA
jgi:predicted DNA-binding transcriptional regulator YafY